MNTQFDDIIKFYCTSFQLDEKLIKAFCLVESNFDPYATRYEPEWKYIDQTSLTLFAHLAHTTVATEIVHQSTSWGLMQVMGSVAREEGFDLRLPMLCLPEHGLEMGCKKIARLSKFYFTHEEVASAYNAGVAKKDDKGQFINQDYVDRIMKAYNELI